MITFRLDWAWRLNEKARDSRTNVQQRAENFISAILSLCEARKLSKFGPSGSHVSRLRRSSFCLSNPRLIHDCLRQVVRPGGRVIGQPEARVDLGNDDLTVGRTNFVDFLREQCGRVKAVGAELDLPPGI